MLVEGVQIGAPGVYYAADPAEPELLGVRMDVCAFVGVAPRGPARVPYTDEELIEADARPRPRLGAARARRRSTRTARAGARSPFPSRAGTTTSGCSAPSRARGGCRMPSPRSSSRAAAARTSCASSTTTCRATSRQRTWARRSGGCADSRSTGAESAPPPGAERGQLGKPTRARLSFDDAAAPAGAAPRRTEVVVSPGSAPAAGTLLRLRLSGGTPDLRPRRGGRARPRPGAAARSRASSLRLAAPRRSRERRDRRGRASRSTTATAAPSASSGSPSAQRTAGGSAPSSATSRSSSIPAPMGGRRRRAEKRGPARRGREPLPARARRLPRL